MIATERTSPVDLPINIRDGAGSSLHGDVRHVDHRLVLRQPGLNAAGQVALDLLVADADQLARRLRDI